MALSPALIAAHRDIETLAPYLHLPVQSGSDKILAAMNRRHSAALYKERVAALREARGDIALSSDFIVGFPGETDADFAATLALAAEVGYAQAYSFKYSPRPGTPAAAMPDQVPEEAKAERLAGLQQLLSAQQHRFNRRSVGGVQEVLLAGPGRVAGQRKGRGPWMQQVSLTAPEALDGSMVQVRITRAGPHGLSGRLEGAPPRNLPRDLSRSGPQGAALAAASG